MVGRGLVVALSLLAALVFACYSKPDAPQLTDDGGGSGSGSDVRCIGPSDDWSGSGSACGTWGGADLTGTGSGSANVTRTGDTLQAFVGAPGMRAGCQTLSTFDFVKGVSIQIMSVPMMPAGDTVYFTVTFPNGFATLKITTGSPPTLDWSCSTPAGGGSHGVMVAPGEYLKFAPSSTSADVIALQYSLTGTAFVSIATCQFTGLDFSKVSVQFGIQAGSTAGSRGAVFDNFKTCTSVP